MPEAEPFHFASRVRIPVLMLSGELDHLFPLETSAKHLFELLGTPESLKRHVVEEGGHLLRDETVITETLEWFDRFVGPVRQYPQRAAPAVICVSNTPAPKARAFRVHTSSPSAAGQPLRTTSGQHRF
jgi:hypothetical protein